MHEAICNLIWFDAQWCHSIQSKLFHLTHLSPLFSPPKGVTMIWLQHRIQCWPTNIWPQSKSVTFAGDSMDLSLDVTCLPVFPLSLADRDNDNGWGRVWQIFVTNDSMDLSSLDITCLPVFPPQSLRQWVGAGVAARPHWPPLLVSRLPQPFPSLPTRAAGIFSSQIYNSKLLAQNAKTVRERRNTDLVGDENIWTATFWAIAAKKIKCTMTQKVFLMLSPAAAALKKISSQWIEFKKCIFYELWHFKIHPLSTHAFSIEHYGLGNKQQILVQGFCVNVFWHFFAKKNMNGSPTNMKLSM